MENLFCCASTKLASIDPNGNLCLVFYKRLADSFAGRFFARFTGFVL